MKPIETMVKEAADLYDELRKLDPKAYSVPYGQVYRFCDHERTHGGITANWELTSTIETMDDFLKFIKDNETLIRKQLIDVKADPIKFVGVNKFFGLKKTEVRWWQGKDFAEDMHIMAVGVGVGDPDKYRQLYRQSVFETKNQVARRLLGDSK
jgi:hypothetical protein